MKKGIIILLASICLMGCGNKERTSESLQELKASSTEESMILWTSDTILETNPELVKLLDTLYQYVRNDSVERSVDENEEWMNNYRQSLCAYYDAHHLGTDTISEFAKVDSVLNHAEKLYELDEDYSTMGMVVRNAISYYTIDYYGEYNLFAQLLDACQNENAKNLLRREYALYNQIWDKMTFVGHIVGLYFWGGSISGPIATGLRRELSNARKEMYHRVICCYKEVPYEYTYGVYLNSANRLFFECVDKSINIAVERMDAFQNEWHEYGDDSYQRFQETAKEARQEVSELRPLMNKWVEQWEKLDDELTKHDSRRYNIERIASKMLIEWACMISSIE